MNFRAFLCVFLMPAVLFAQTPPISVLPGEDKITAVSKGEPAPYAGQLFDPTTALRWGFAIQQYELRLDLDVKKAQDICKAETDYRDQLLKVEKERAATESKDLRNRLLASEKARLVAEEEARNPPWFRSREFGLVLGVLGTAGLVGLSIWALEARN